MRIRSSHLSRPSQLPGQDPRFRIETGVANKWIQGWFPNGWKMWIWVTSSQTKCHGRFRITWLVITLVTYSRAAVYRNDELSATRPHGNVGRWCGSSGSGPQLISFQDLDEKWPFSKPAGGKCERSTHISYTSLERNSLRTNLAEFSDLGVRFVFRSVR